MTSQRGRAMAMIGGCVVVAAALFAPSAALARPSTLPVRDVYADTWVATDALGRALPTYEQVGPPRKDRTAALFYFLWMGQHSLTGPWDITRILAAHPEARLDSANPAWGPMGHFHHWGEPLFGYYVSDDRWVIRKHAGLLAAAGVDALVFDTTNNFTYDKCWNALGDTFTQARDQGNATPAFAFIAPFGDANSVVRRLYDNLYKPRKYEQHWFRWDGKPLILANPVSVRGDGLSSLEHDLAVRLEAGGTLAQTFAVPKTIGAVAASTPTWSTSGAAVRISLRRGGPDGPVVASRRVENVLDNAWTTLDVTPPQPAGRYTLELSEPSGTVGWWTNRQPTLPDAQAHADGKPVPGTRSFSVSNADDRVRSIMDALTFRAPVASYFTGPSGPDQWGWLEVFPQHLYKNSKGEGEMATVGVAQNAVDGKLSALSEERSLGRSYHGGSWDKRPNAVSLGLNFSEQWERALKLDPRCVFITGWNEWVAQRFDTNSRPTFVDQFSQEGSRDVEPMRGGHGDAYYYQMVANIRRYKGVRPVPSVVSRPVKIDGRFEDWRAVQPEFRDFIGDAVNRDHEAWGGSARLVNTSARNDITVAKVSRSASALSFYVRTQAPLTPPTGSSWMLLYIDADRNPRTGWLGYDFIVGRGGLRGGSTTLERYVGSGYQWTPVAQVKAAMRGSELELSIPIKALGLRSVPAALDFKWADNVRQSGDWSGFYEDGDVAPDARFNYRARLR